MCIVILLLIDIFEDQNLFFFNLAVIPIFAASFTLFQICFSWLFPIEVMIFNDRICAIGAWKIKHKIKYKDIKYVLFNDCEFLVQKKNIFFNRILFTKLQDPEQKVRELLLTTIENNKINISIRNEEVLA